MALGANESSSAGTYHRADDWYRFGWEGMTLCRCFPGWNDRAWRHLARPTGSPTVVGELTAEAMTAWEMDPHFAAAPTETTLFPLASYADAGRRRADAAGFLAAFATIEHRTGMQHPENGVSYLS